MAVAPVEFDPSFDRYARMTARALQVPVALVTIIEGTRQTLPGAHGLPVPYGVRPSSDYSDSLCQYVVRAAAPLIVADVATDERLERHRDLVVEGVGAYAGHPITDHRHDVIGSLCALSPVPRVWSADDTDNLRDLAAACSAEVAQRELRRLAHWEGISARQEVERGRLLLALSEALADTASLVDIATVVDRVAAAQLGSLRAALWLLPGEPRSAEPEGPSDEVRHLDLVHLAGDEGAALTQHDELLADGHNPVGDACARQQPLFFATRDDQQDVYPDFHITETFGQARGFLPLTINATTMGILVVGWPSRRTFDDADQATIGALATYTAQALARVLLLEERLETSLTLQQAMLTELPSPVGLQLAARYRPASALEQVGGDWYDALVLPTGRTGVVCGDVGGHDIVAAAAMGQMRSTLRTLAWADDTGPARPVEMLDLALGGLGISALATLVYAQIERSAEGTTWEVAWTSAGHPPPVLIDPHGSIRVLEPTHEDLLLGVIPGEVRHVERLVVQPGSTLLLYTDGLVERRGESLDDGLERLTRSLVDLHAGSLDDLLDGVLTAQLGDSLEDDVAVLAVGFGAP